MRKRNLPTDWTLVACAILATSATLAAQPERSRAIRFKQGVPLVSQLLPDDTLVTVEREGDSAGTTTVGTPDASDYVLDALGGAVAAVVLRVESVEPRLTEDESWLQTEVIGRITEVLMSRAPALTRGRLISISHEWGGEALLYGVRVRAGRPLALRQGASCLAFLVRDDARPWVALSGLLMVQDGVLVDPARGTYRNGGRHGLDGLRFPTVRRLVERLWKDLRQD